MFARTHRFSFKKGAPRLAFSTKLFVIRYDRKKESGLECSVIVGKKVDKRAVIRNKIKRQTVALIKEIVSLDSPFRLAIYAKRPVLDTERTEMQSDLQKAFDTIGITKWT